MSIVMIALLLAFVNMVSLLLFVTNFIFSVMTVRLRSDILQSLLNFVIVMD